MGIAELASVEDSPAGLCFIVRGDTMMLFPYTKQKVSNRAGSGVMSRRFPP